VKTLSNTEVTRRYSRLIRGADESDMITIKGTITSAFQEGRQLSFWMLNDGTAEIQVLLTAARLGVDEHAAASQVGDQAEVTGAIIRSRSGVLTVDARTIARPASEGRR
jgi:lysyl-tRNA synthetase class II